MIDGIVKNNSIGSGYRYNRASELFGRYPTVHTVEFHRRGDRLPNASARPGIIVYIMATGGRWGKSVEVRVHPDDLHAEQIATERAARQSAEDSVLTADLRALQAELAAGNCYRLQVETTMFRGPRLQLVENIHPGSFTFTDGLNGLILRTVEDVRRLMAGHATTFHGVASDGQ